MTGLEPEGTVNWLLVAVLALTLLRLCFLVCFFSLAHKLFALEIMRCEPLRMSQFYIRATSVAPGAEGNILCIMEIFMPLLPYQCACLKKGHRKSMPAFSTENPRGAGCLWTSSLGTQVVWSVVTSVPPSSLTVPGFSSVAFDSM